MLTIIKDAYDNLTEDQKVLTVQQFCFLATLTAPGMIMAVCLSGSPSTNLVQTEIAQKLLDGFP